MGIRKVIKLQKKPVLPLILFVLSFLYILFLLIQKNKPVFRGESASAGILLLLIYFSIAVFIEINITMNSLIALAFLILIPISVIFGSNYSAETFAVFGFLMLVICIVQLTIEVQKE